MAGSAPWRRTRRAHRLVFKKYSQMKLQMKREALEKLNRRASEMLPASGESIGTVTFAVSGSGTVLARSRPEIINWSGRKVGKCFRINCANHVGA